MQKKYIYIKERLLVSEIITSQMAAGNCLHYEGNTCHGQSIL